MPIWDGSNGDTRKASMTTLLAYITSNFTDPDYTTRIVAPSATGFTIDAGSTGDSLWLIVNPVAAYASGSLWLPPSTSAVNNQEIVVTFTAAVTALSVTGVGATVSGFPSGIGTNDTFRLRYNTEQLTWYAISTVDAVSVPYTPAGTGAVVTDVQAKLREISVTPKDHGADLTGATDATTSIRSALASLTSGGTLRFTAGNYTIDTSNRIEASGIFYNPYFFNIDQDNTSIVFDRGATITVTASGGLHADLFVISAENNIDIDGVVAVGVPYVMTDEGGAETTGGILYGVSMYTSSSEDYADIKITNNDFRYCLRGGVHQTSSTLTNGYIVGNTLRNVRGHGITVYKASQCKILDNHIYKQETYRQNPYTSGSTFQGTGIDVSDYSNSVLVANNIIDDCVFGLKAESDPDAASQDASDTTIESNIISNVNLAEVYGAAVGYYGIKAAAERVLVTNNNVRNCYGAAIVMETGDNEQATVSFNIISGSMGNAIEVTAQDDTPADVVRDRTLISGNTILGQIAGKTAPIGIGGYAPYLTISNNKIKDVTVGIQSSGNGYNNLIIGNTIKSCSSHGIYGLSPDTATFDVYGLMIQNNNIELSGTGGEGIYLLRVDRTSVIANKVVSLIDSTAQRGIYVSTDISNDSGGYLIANNQLERWFRNIQTNNALNVQVVGNNILGYLGATADRGINVASTANGLIGGNLVANCKEGIVSQSDNANVLIDSNNTSSCTTGLTSTSATTGTNV
jgi:hypothetical protein